MPPCPGTCSWLLSWEGQWTGVTQHSPFLTFPACPETPCTSHKPENTWIQISHLLTQALPRFSSVSEMGTQTIWGTLIQFPELMEQIWKERVLKNTELKRKGHGMESRRCQARVWVKEMPETSLHAPVRSLLQRLVGNP